MATAEYLRRYRAEASDTVKARENARNKAWWRAHRRLAQAYPEEFKALYEEEKRGPDNPSGSIR